MDGGNCKTAPAAQGLLNTMSNVKEIYNKVTNKIEKLIMEL